MQPSRPGIAVIGAGIVGASIAYHLARRSTRVTLLDAGLPLRAPAVAEIVRTNRKGGPEQAIDLVEERAPDGFAKLEDVATREELEAGGCQPGEVQPERREQADLLTRWRQPGRRRPGAAGRDRWRPGCSAAMKTPETDGCRVTMANYDSYVICTSPRSGSTLLCSLLAATGVAGDPDSHFHRPSLAEWLADFGITPDPAASQRSVLEAVFRAAIARGRGATGIFGLRLQRHSFDFFVRQLAILHPERPGEAGRFEAAFGRTLFIHLSRHDKVEQAVSYVRAEQSGLWHVAPDGTELERLAPPREPVYDGAEILASVETMTAHDRDWEQWFAREAIDPMRIAYDALASDPSGSLRQVLERLGIDPTVANGVGPGVRKLADGTSRDWVARFRSESGIA